MSFGIPPPPPPQGSQSGGPARPPQQRQQPQRPPPFVLKVFEKLGINDMNQLREITLTKLMNVVEEHLKEVKESDGTTDENFVKVLLSVSMQTKRPLLQEIVDAVTKCVQLTLSYFDQVKPVYAVLLLTAGSYVETVGLGNFPLTEELCQLYITSLSKFFESELDDQFVRLCDSLPPCSQIFCTKHTRLLKQIRDNDAFIQRLNKVRYSSSGIKMLHMLLEAMFEEKFIILDYETKKGFEVVMSGCSDNVQFSALLANELIPHHLKGNRTSEVASLLLKGEIPPQTLPKEQIVGNWDMYNWLGISEDGSLNKNHDLWVWCEGTPSDIAKFVHNGDGKLEDEEDEEAERENQKKSNFKEKGVRVLLLAKPMYQRYHACTRTFTNLRAEVKVTKVMGEEESKFWFKRLREAGREARDRAKSFVSSRIVSGPSSSPVPPPPNMTSTRIDGDQK